MIWTLAGAPFAGTVGVWEKAATALNKLAALARISQIAGRGIMINLRVDGSLRGPIRALMVTKSAKKGEGSFRRRQDEQDFFKYSTRSACCFLVCTFIA